MSTSSSRNIIAGQNNDLRSGADENWVCGTGSQQWNRAQLRIGVFCISDLGEQLFRRVFAEGSDGDFCS